MVAELIGKIGGQFRLGVIPTIAPYLIPSLVQPFLARYPDVQLTLSEHYTADILPMLELGRLDAALIATNEDAHWLETTHLFDDAFIAYVSPSSELYRKTTLNIEDLEHERLWLLQDGHCLKGQVLQLCRVDRQQDGPQVKYEAGSLDTLQRMVDRYGGATLLPALAISTLSSAQLKRIRYFKEPEPTRPIVLASRKNSGRAKLKEALAEMILEIRKHPN
jgi:LysR family hydrogen peroxide-inducible transcriptional activator